MPDVHLFTVQNQSKTRRKKADTVVETRCFSLLNSYLHEESSRLTPLHIQSALYPRCFHLQHTSGLGLLDLFVELLDGLVVGSEALALDGDVLIGLLAAKGADGLVVDVGGSLAGGLGRLGLADEVEAAEEYE